MDEFLVRYRVGATYDAYMRRPYDEKRTKRMEAFGRAYRVQMRYADWWRNVSRLKYLRINGRRPYVVEVQSC